MLDAVPPVLTMTSTMLTMTGYVISTSTIRWLPCSPAPLLLPLPPSYWPCYFGRFARLSL